MAYLGQPVFSGHQPPGLQARQLLLDGVAATPEEVNEAVRQYYAQGPHPLPPGCEPNAIKLFVGNIPKQLTEADLKPIFSCIGPCARISVVRCMLLPCDADRTFPLALFFSCGNMPVAAANLLASADGSIR